MSFIVGKRVTVRCVFRDQNGVSADPTTVQVTVKRPNGVVTTYNTADITRTGVGTYERAVDLDVAGRWRLRVSSTGTVMAVYEDALDVLPSQVI